MPVQIPFQLLKYLGRDIDTHFFFLKEKAEVPLQLSATTKLLSHSTPAQGQTQRVAVVL